MRTTEKVAGLLFCSGACALIYQTVWMRQFRLIFGASTLATAAVLAIFLGGLGIGSAILGKRADGSPRPIRFYGNLELAIAASSALSPLLLWIVARIYFGAGGSVTLGPFLATILRLILATIVMGLPAVLMGGTIPAAARGVESDDDAGRRRVALLYAANTLGAVVGTLGSTFVLLEALGNRRTLFAAAAVNVLVGIAARNVIPSEARDPLRAGDSSPSARLGMTARAGDSSPSARLGMTRMPVLLAAGIVGFAFLLMELVWYRMLAPLLGGTTFTFGLILAIALLGIGLGGAAYSFWSGNRRATPGGFALTCSLEAAAMAIPFVLGDRLAVQENFLRSLGTVGFSGFVMAWMLLTLIVVFPPAFVAGVQFPLLISLLGQGRRDVGREVGLAYAWNTAGAIAGSLAGGFGLLPVLSAPGAWRLAIVVLALVSVAARRHIVSVAIAVLAIAGTFALGPTALWRHSGIGAGRSETPTSINATREWVNGARRTLVWDVDGRESSVALVDGADFAFIVNGKADGSARGDAGTQVMGGMVGATLHPDPRRALVIGLGTGSTAGWLGAVPSMQRVDVVELEPAVIGVARACSAVNQEVLHNPKVHIRIGDAREVLLTSRERYDIIFSEPSNPYRAGVASLFTEEFYRATAARLNPNGIFLQWLQAYDVDNQTIRTIYATICAVFPNVETWQTDVGDLLLVGTRQPIDYDFDAIRRRLTTEPFRSAMANAWRVESLEGFLSHYVARDSLARTLAHQEISKNTDDKTPIEFGFARGLGSQQRFAMNELTGAARTRGEDRPANVRGTFNWAVWASNRASISYVEAGVQSPTQEDLARHRAARHYSDGELAQALAEWRAHPWPPVNSGELVMLAESLADAASTAAEPYAEQLRVWEPTDADAVLARLRFRQNRPEEAVALLEKVFVECRRDPWPTVDVIGRSLDLALTLSKTHAFAARLYHALDLPFAAGQWEDVRRFYRAQMAHEMEGCGPHTIAALRALEPWPPWRRDLLEMRKDCYANAMLPSLAARARREYDQFLDGEPRPLLRPARSPSGSS